MDVNYLISLPGILKLIESVLCLGGFISAMFPSSVFTSLGGGWVQFVTLTAIFGVIIILVLNTCFKANLPIHFPLLVFVFYLTFTVFLLIAGILAAVRAGQLAPAFGSSFYSDLYIEAIPASAAFVLVAFVVFVVDTLISINIYKKSKKSTRPSGNQRRQPASFQVAYTIS